MTGPPTSLPVHGDPAKVTCKRCRRAASLDPDASHDRVTAVLRAARRDLTATEIAAAAQVSRTQAVASLHRMDAEGRVDVDRQPWPSTYRLKPDPEPAAGPPGNVPS